MHLSGTHAGLCPELTLFLGETKKTFLIKTNKFGGQFYKPNRVHKHKKKPYCLKKMFYSSRVLLKSPCFSKILTINLDKIVTKTQKQLFRHKSVLKLKNWRKQNQPGIKFYKIECVEFKFETFLTEISRNLDFPHFQLFQIFAQLHLWSILSLF